MLVSGVQFNDVSFEGPKFRLRGKNPVTKETRVNLKTQSAQKDLNHIDDAWVDTDMYNMSDDEYFERQARSAARKAERAKKWENLKKAVIDFFS